MNARRYALTLIVGAFTLFASTVVANVVLDPQQVFETGLFPPTNNINQRNRKLLAYKQNARATDGVLFASSRGNFFDERALSRKMGITAPLNASVPYGMISDHLPLLDHILRDKSAHGERIKAVLLMLDADFFGKPPWTGVNVDAFLPPELSGESAARYRWRYLTAVQFRLWRDVIRADREPAVPAARVAMPPVEPRTVGQGGNEAGRFPVAPRFSSYRRSFNTARPDLDRQIAQLGRFVALCRDHGVDLRIAVSPAIAENLQLHEPGVLAAVVERMSRTGPLWDFTSSPVSMQRSYWADFSHYNDRTAAMMLDRIYGGDEAVAGFGVLRDAR